MNFTCMSTRFYVFYTILQGGDISEHGGGISVRACPEAAARAVLAGRLHL